MLEPEVFRINNSNKSELQHHHHHQHNYDHHYMNQQQQQIKQKNYHPHNHNQQIQQHHYSSHHQPTPPPLPNDYMNKQYDKYNSSNNNNILNGNLNNIIDNKERPTVVYVGDGRSRVRRVVRTQTRHITVVSYSKRHKESQTHTSHHVTTVR